MIRAVRNALAAAGLGVLAAAAAAADPVPCPDDPSIRVAGAGPDRMGAICGRIAEIRPYLAACHLRQSRPLVIRVTQEPPHAIAPCLGTYDCRDGSVSVTDPAHLPDLLVPGSIWARIDPEALFRSLLAHELTHAFLDQMACKGVLCHADHEYVAYAMQIGVLSDADRAAVLAGHGIADPVDPAFLNEGIAMMAPNAFAQAAWLHFAEPGHGCDFVAALIDGRATLYVDPY